VWLSEVIDVTGCWTLLKAVGYTGKTEIHMLLLLAQAQFSKVLKMTLG